MDIGTINRWGRILEDSMRLRSLPIAVKFYEKSADIPAEAVRPMERYGKHMAFCQSLAYTRMKGMTMALCTQDHWCWTPLVCFGNVDCAPGDPAFEMISSRIGVPGSDAARKFFARLPRFPRGKYEAVVSAPLSKCSFEPDVVLVYADAARTNHMVRTIKAVIGGRLDSSFDYIDSCIYSTIPPFVNNEYRITFPDPGDRERARARDDEVIVSIPGARLGEFMETFEKQNDSVAFGDQMFGFRLDVPRPKVYNDLFDIWGLGTGEEWERNSSASK